MLSPFRVISPTTVPEAAAELERLGDAALIYAGGAELLLLMRHGLLEPDYLVNIKQVPSLHDIHWDGRVLRLGAAVTHRELERAPLVREHAPTLGEAEGHVGNIRVRNQGTLGGNLCFADPHADPGTALLVHDASVTVEGTRGPRQLPLDDFFVSTYETALDPAELLTEVQVPRLPAGWGWSFERIERFYRPTVNAAAAVAASDGHIAEARLAVGCVGPRALRLRELEDRIKGLRLADARREDGESSLFQARTKHQPGSRDDGDQREKQGRTRKPATTPAGENRASTDRNTRQRGRAGDGSILQGRRLRRPTAARLAHSALGMDKRDGTKFASRRPSGLDAGAVVESTTASL